MAEQKDKPTVKKLPCGGHAIFTIDQKSKQLTQTGYIGASLEVDKWIPEGYTVSK